MARSIDTEAQQGDNARYRPQVNPVKVTTNGSVGEEHSQSTSGESPQHLMHNEHALKLGWKERIRYFTWTFFTMTMATGGIANVIHACPLRFTGLYEIGVFFMMLNMVIFICNTIAISLRFYYWPSAFRYSLTHPAESIFVPAPLISIAIMLVNITEYGLAQGKCGHWLVDTMTVLYWIYIALAFTASLGVYLIMWSTQTFMLSEMTPVWIFPAYPLLLVGPFAATLATHQLGDSALQTVVGGLLVQGIGFMVSFMIYSAYIYRLMTHKLPGESNRPGMFVSVGPSGFTISALIRMGQYFADEIPSDFMGNGLVAGQVTKILANWTGIWLWGLAAWFFFISLGANLMVSNSHRKANFAMTWFSFIFPNTALGTGTFAVAKALDNNFGIQVVGCIILVALIVVWLIVVGMMVRAIKLKQILWPERPDDHEEESRWRQGSTVVNSRGISNIPTSPVGVDGDLRSRMSR